MCTRGRERRYCPCVREIVCVCVCVCVCWMDGCVRHMLRRCVVAECHVFMFPRRRLAQEKQWQVLNRDVTELSCQETKLASLLDAVSQTLRRLATDGDPPKAIELAETPPPPEVSTHTHAHTSFSSGLCFLGLDASCAASTRMWTLT